MENRLKGKLMVGYFHKKIFELNTTPKHFECKLSKHLWEVGLNLNILLFEWNMTIRCMLYLEYSAMSTCRHRILSGPLIMFRVRDPYPSNPNCRVRDPDVFSESIQLIFSRPFQSNFRVWGCSRLVLYYCIIIFNIYIFNLPYYVLLLLCICYYYYFYILHLYSVVSLLLLALYVLFAFLCFHTLLYYYSIILYINIIISIILCICIIILYFALCVCNYI